MADIEKNGDKNKKSYSFLAQWRIENFKSVQSAEINFAPLSVLVGPNSAGKSSLIQSILLFAQNCSRQGREFDGNLRGQFILNGDLVNLGTIEEAHCDFSGSVGKEIGFGATYRLGSDRGAFFLRRTTALSGKSPSNSDAATVLNWDLALMNEPETRDSGTAVVRNLHISLTSNDAMTEKMYVEFTNGEHVPREAIDDRPDFSEKYQAKLEFKKNQIGKIGDSPNELFSEVAYAAISFNAGLPTEGRRLLTQYDKELETQKKLFSTYGFLLDDIVIDSIRESQNGELLDKKLAMEKCVPLFFEKLANLKESDSQSPSPRGFRSGLLIEGSPLLNLYSIKWNSLQEFIKTNSEITELVLSDRWNKDKAEELIEKVADDLDQKLHSEMVDFWEQVSVKIQLASINHKLPEKIFWDLDRDRSRYGFFDSKIFAANESWSHQLSRGIRYLEPLREAPKANYTYSSGGAISPQIPLGSKGEHLAQRLYDRRLDIFPLPNNLDNKTKMPLVQAVNEWLTFLDIDGPIKVVPQGRSGFQLTVGGKVLPMLGTGISQVLPVLTLCLIARRGDLILLEQPELHLNPSLQQTLADFLLAMSKTNRQIIVETHSEYLVTRLRLNSLIEDNPNLCKIFFVEKDGKTGTQYREVESNQFGEITQWPKGFFDQASSDYKRLIMKIVEKKEILSRQDS